MNWKDLLSKVGAAAGWIAAIAAALLCISKVPIP